MRINPWAVVALAWTGLMAAVIVAGNAAGEAAPRGSFLEAARGIIGAFLFLGWLLVLFAILLHDEPGKQAPSLRAALSPSGWRGSTWAMVFWTALMALLPVSSLDLLAARSSNSAAGYATLYSAVGWPIGLFVILIARGRAKGPPPHA